MSEQNNSSRLRKSTVESSRQLEIFLQERKIKSQNRKGNKKSGKATETEVVTTYSKEINEVVDLADNSENLVETEQNIEIEDPYVDPLAGLTPGSSRRLRSVSTEVNRFECGNVSSLSPDRVGLIPHSESDVHELNLSTINEVFELKMEEAVYKEN